MARTVTLEELVRKRPYLYFGNQQPSAGALRNEIVTGAKVLGAHTTSSVEIGPRNFIYSNKDWLYLGRFPEKGESIWSAPYGFPERGVNCCRYEAIAKACSSRLITWSKKGIESIKGHPMNHEQLKRLLPDYQKFERVIGFEFRAL